MPYRARPARFRWTLLALCASLTMLGACGQKGPLYLPDQTPAPAETAPGEDGENDEQPKQKRDGA
jgi:predicted small lipoprotein YifL